MPDDLTKDTTTIRSDPPRSGPLTDAVLTVLAGASPEQTATEARIDPAELLDAVETYHAAGRAALDTRTDTVWQHVNIRFPNPATAEDTAATRLAPALRDLVDQRAVAHWWFLRKHPHWRLRLRIGHHPNAHAALDETLQALCAAGTIEHWQRAVYEPETHAFGGPVGMAAAHLHFCADSAGVLDYLTRPAPRIGRREVSVLLCSTMFTAAGLDRFETGDVWDKVADLRHHAPGTDGDGHERLAGQLARLTATDTTAEGPLFRPGTALAFAAPWARAFAATGYALRAGADADTLERGIRRCFAQLVIFHWNRLGLGADTQAHLARAGRAAALPGTRP